MTVVHASNIYSRDIIHCEVFIDRISWIQIFHHSVKLNLDGLATLHVHAFDDEGLTGAVNEQLQSAGY